MQAVLPFSRPRPPALQDLALALGLFAAGQAEAWTPFHTSLGGGSNAAAAATGAALTLPLAARRPAPVPVALAIALPVPIVAMFDPDVRLLFFGGLLPLLVVTYTLASRARPLVATAIPFAALLAIELEVAPFRKTGEIVFDWLWFTVAAGLGFVVRARSQRAERSESRVVELEAEREAVLREERARIARELHDVIAHSMSVIVVQAGAAEPLVAESPAHAQEALRSIRSTASDALGEMRRLLGILREQGDELSLAPQPSVAALEPLLAQARGGGLDVRLRVEGEPRPLAPGLDVAAYRIVQEALTNTRKHGRASSADVALRYTPAAVEIEVLDDGAGGHASENGGHGIVGMRERVGLYGGTLEVGPRPAGGFGVRAVLPTS